MKPIIILIFVFVITSLTSCTSGKNQKQPTLDTSFDKELNTCQTDLEFAHDYLVKNDAGAQYHISQKGLAHFEAELKQSLQLAKEVTEVAECNLIINRYLDNWRTSHLGTNKVKGWFSKLFLNAFGELILSSIYEPNVEALSENTVLITLPSFKYSLKEDIETLLLENKTLLENAPNWIIDVSENRGGSDVSFGMLVSWINPTPVKIDGVEQYITQDNINAYTSLCKEYDLASICPSLINFMKAQPLNTFANWHEYKEARSTKKPSKKKYPKLQHAI